MIVECCILFLFTTYGILICCCHKLDIVSNRNFVYSEVYCINLLEADVLNKKCVHIIILWYWNINLDCEGGYHWQRCIMCRQQVMFISSLCHSLYQIDLPVVYLNQSAVVCFKIVQDFAVIVVTYYSYIFQTILLYSMSLTCFRYVYYCMKYVNNLLSFGIKPIMVFDGCRLPSKHDVEKSRRE